MNNPVIRLNNLTAFAQEAFLLPIRLRPDLNQLANDLNSCAAACEDSAAPAGGAQELKPRIALLP